MLHPENLVGYSYNQRKSGEWEKTVFVFFE